MVRLAALIGAVAAAAPLVAAHPGESHSSHHLKREIDARNAYAQHAKRALAACSGSEAHQKLTRRNIKRRHATVDRLREKRGIKSRAQKYRRDLAALQEWETVNHNMTGQVCYTPDTAPSTIFAADTSCILAPEVTDGPYYVFGELIRQNVKEDLYCDGVDLYLEVQYIDINTCSAVEDVFVDIWNANATGVYSGIVATGNDAGWDTTFLRGIQVTDSDGVVEFETIFPGHYEGRATHTHLLAHMNATRYDNNTIAEDGTVTHIGQLFYPEDLIDDVEAVYPYSSNTVERTTNDEDMWSIVQADDSYDPFPEFLYLGEDVSDGLFAWIQIGVNASADYTDDDYYSVAAHLYAEGGVQNSDGAMGGGDGGDMGGDFNGTAPTGTMGGEMPTDMPTQSA